MRKQSDVEELSNSSEFNEDYYKEYWGSVSNFSENGFGYCILHKGKVVSECTSIFSSLQYSEIDIATHEDYRGQGLHLAL
ncbi:GNAT family N-acetyltransferase [Peribacillus butanolivorans]|uniref:GNAT family N-acetyltransferase n=1 Tax=Peribacillus butanolivorans TaxID=421767 RepID=UPI0035DDAFA9